MMMFEKTVEKVLPYDRHEYIEFLFGESSPSVKWYGVSFQLNEKESNLSTFVETYQCWFEKVILSIDKGSSWIVNHDKDDLTWFPNNENNLKALRTLFKIHKVKNKFKGALIFSKDDLIALSRDLISYPYAVFNEEGLFYMDVDISYLELPVIIKISNHLNIDLLSTDLELLKEIVNAGD